jgi:hypothetical protein
MRREEAIAAGAALGAEAGSPLDFAGLLVKLANPHFFFDSASLHQFAETADGFLSRFLVT